MPKGITIEIPIRVGIRYPELSLKLKSISEDGEGKINLGFDVMKGVLKLGEVEIDANYLQEKIAGFIAHE